MKKTYTRYLSQRIKIVFLGLVIVNVFFLVTFTVVGLYKSKYLYSVTIGWVILFITLYVTYKWILIPYRENAKILKLFASGYSLQDIFEQQVPLSPEIESTIDKFEEIIETADLVNASKKQAQYLALQNQINPHFLYNTLESIRGETLVAGLDNVAKMTEALATFFRYTISNIENLVTLEDELENIDNYYIIQQYRFGEKLNLSIIIDSDNKSKVLQYKLPKLTLQPIVENSIYHGLERKIGKGNLTIKIQTTRKRLLITISDDGLGMTKERTVELNDKFNGTSIDDIKNDNESKGGIAMVNVNTRIKLLFGEEYGIHIYSTLGSGTDVEITLPLIEKE